MKHGAAEPQPNTRSVAEREEKSQRRRLAGMWAWITPFASTGPFAGWKPALHFFSRPQITQRSHANRNLHPSAVSWRHEHPSQALERSALSLRRVPRPRLPLPPSRPAQEPGDVGHVDRRRGAQPRAPRGLLRQAWAAHRHGGIQEALPCGDALPPRGRREVGRLGRPRDNLAVVLLALR